MCGLAPLVVAATLVSAPMCPRLDTSGQVMAALLGDARIETVATDPQFEAAIRAIHAPAPKAARRRSRR